MRILVLGASGAAGGSLLDVALSSPLVEEVRTLSRKRIETGSARHVGVVHDDLFDYRAVAGTFAGLDAAFYCIGRSVSQVGEEAAYRRLAFEAAEVAAAQLAAARAAAQRLRMDARVVEFRTVDGMFAALRATAEGRVQALAMLTSPLVYSSSKGLAEWVTKTKMPAISPFRAFADAGGLMSYGPDLLVFRRFSGTYVDRILKGAQPADLPIQQPAKFQFVVNQRAAKALGVVLPQALLLRADEVIQ